MVRALPDSLHELIRFGGQIRVKCRRCGREARFDTYSLWRYFRAVGVRDDWKTIRTKFVCSAFGQGCGGRNVEVSYELDAPDPPPAKPEPCLDCPPGINPREWAKADPRERKRLIRNLR